MQQCLAWKNSSSLSIAAIFASTKVPSKPDSSMAPSIDLHGALSRMRTTIMLLALFAFGASAVAAPDSSVETGSFRHGSTLFSITATIRDVTSPGTYDDHEIAYTVRRDGKFLHRQDADGGKVPGCRYGTARPKGVVKPLKIGTEQIGWQIVTGGICGNTSSQRVQFIVLSDMSPDRYSTRTFMPKTDPKLDVADGVLTVTYLYQEWGDAGTAGSFFVPVRFTVTPKGKYDPIKAASMGGHLKSWPAFEGLPYTLPSYVVAGINDADPAPIRAAAALWTEKDGEHLAYVGLPKTKEELEKLADGVAQVGPIISKFNRPIRYSGRER